jgi:hypothetical protein
MRTRTLLSDRLKQAIEDDPRPIGILAADHNINYTQLSALRNGHNAVGPMLRVRVLSLAADLGVSEAEAFRKVEVE